MLSKVLKQIFDQVKNGWLHQGTYISPLQFVACEIKAQEENQNNFFMNKINCVAFLNTACISTVSSFLATNIAMYHPSLCFYGGMSLGVIGLYHIRKIKPIYYSEVKNGHVDYKTVNPLSRLLAHALTLMGTGLMISPTIYIFQTMYPHLMPWSPILRAVALLNENKIE